MKTCFIFIFFSLSFSDVSVFAQADTLELVRYHDGSKTFYEIFHSDTFFKALYPNGHIEGMCKVRNWQCNGIYRRYHPNGNLMWEKQMQADTVYGEVKLYSSNRILLARLRMSGSRVLETLFLKEDVYLVLGKIISRSTVYGGVEYADGRSNVSEYEGPYKYKSMYAAVIDSGRPAFKISDFRTDFLGDFFVLASKGRIGFFSSGFDLLKIEGNRSLEPSGQQSSGSYNWSADQNIYFTEPGLKQIGIRYSSVGYAP
ncbi:MAG: hypothetical protein RLZZ46_702 [Bacteroidota bacterium]|jgi:hypothetical protein